MEKYILIVVIVAISFALGFFVCYISRKNIKDGTIVLENSSDGDRICMRFVLDIDLEDIEKKKRIELIVDNQLS